MQPRVALEYAKRTLEIEPRSPEALNGLADVYEALGLFESAAEVYRRCLLEDPVFMDPYIFGALPLM